MDDAERRLARLFERVGRAPAGELRRQDLPLVIADMRERPDIVAQQIGRFSSYLRVGQLDTARQAIVALNQIAAAVPEVRDAIVQSMGHLLVPFRAVHGQPGLSEDLEQLEKTLDLPLTDADAHIQNLVRSVVDLQQPLVLIVGAGFSYEQMPITQELRTFLVPILKRRGVVDPIRLLHEDENEAWRRAVEDADEFKSRFAGRCSGLAPAPQHYVVAAMLNSGQIAHLISFNWDDLVERAYERFGAIAKVTSDDDRDYPPGTMWKLHGDVEQTENDWVWPNERGRVFRNLMRSLEALQRGQHPAQYALVIGYSESDELVRRELIGWLERNVQHVLRIRPTEALDAHVISDTARRFCLWLEVQSKLRAVQRPSD